MKELFILALIFILMDIVSGILASAVHGEISSSAMRKGLYHKTAEVLLMSVGVAGQIAVRYAELNSVIPDAIFQSVIVYVVAMELVSILENINKANPKLKLNELLNLFGKQGTNKEE